MFEKIGLTCREIDVEGKCVGDIIDINGKRFKITKKTNTAIAVERWYWFDKIIAKLLKRIEGDE
jgi:hypothetical protein